MSTEHFTLRHYHVTYAFQSESTLCICFNVKGLPGPNRSQIWNLSECNRTRTKSHLVLKKDSTSWPNQPNDWAELWVGICTEHTTVCCYHVTYGFQSEFKLCNCWNVKEPLSQKRSVIWSLGDCNETRTHKNFSPKKKLNHLVKLTKKLKGIVGIYLYGAFDCMLLSCHVPISEWTYTLHMPEYQGTLFSKKKGYLKFKLLKRDSNHQPPIL